MIPIYSNHSNSKWGKLLALIVLFIIVSCTQNDGITGTVDETDTGIIAMLYNPDGTPAIGANVKIFEVADTTKTPASEVISDENGNYAVSGLAKGTYNIYAEKDELVAFQDSISVLEDTIIIKDDTLETPTNISGVVGLQPNHEPRTVTVQVLGTEIFSNVNEDGYFTLNRMAKGDFTLKLSTTLDNYTTTYENLTITPDTPETLADTLWLIYTGIPVVEGLTATYDTLNGVVTLSWNGTKYRDFQDYLIYRDYFDSLNFSSTPIAFIDDTVFYDSVFDKSMSNGEFSFSDTNDYNFKYRVTVRNNSQDEGLSYKYVGVVAASPNKVEPFIETKTFHNSLQIYTDTCSINDSLQVFIKITEKHRDIEEVIVSRIDSSKVLFSDSIGDGKREIVDTISFCFGTIGEQVSIIQIIDGAKDVWNDTLKIFVTVDRPIIESIDSFYTSANRQLSANISDKYGRAEQFFWKIGNHAWQQTDKAISPIISESSFFEELVCSLKVIDDDENIAHKEQIVRYTPTWNERIESFPSEMSNVVPFVHSNEILFCNERLLYRINAEYEVSTLSTDLPLATDNACSFQGAIWIMEYAKNDSTSAIFISADATEWQLVAEKKASSTCKYSSGGFLIKTDSLIFATDINSCDVASSSSNGTNWNSLGEWHNLYPTLWGYFNNQIYEVVPCEEGWTGTRNLDWMYHTISGTSSSAWVEGPITSHCSSGDNFVSFKDYLILPIYEHGEIYFSKDGFYWTKLTNIPQNVGLISTKKIFEFDGILYLMTNEGLWSIE